MATKKKNNQILKTLILKCKLAHRKRIFRTIEIDSSNSLYDLAETILSSFGFNLDHCFGFYSNFKNRDMSDEAYELFVDEGEDDENMLGIITRSVKETKIQKVFSPKKKMLFLFDYGDNWEFEIECTEKREYTDSSICKILPRVLKITGEAPEQYPDCEEE